MSQYSDDVLKLNPELKAQLSVSKNKWGNIRSGHYQSKKEAEYAQELQLRKQAGDIKCWIEQVPFRLPGNKVHRVDFGIIYPDNRAEFVEVKGRDLPMGKLKRHQVEELYQIEINLV